jgi:hypothetical protein
VELGDVSKRIARKHHETGQLTPLDRAHLRLCTHGACTDLRGRAQRLRGRHADVMDQARYLDEQYAVGVAPVRIVISRRTQPGFATA